MQLHALKTVKVRSFTLYSETRKTHLLFFNGQVTIAQVSINAKSKQTQKTSKSHVAKIQRLGEKMALEIRKNKKKNKKNLTLMPL